MNITEISIDLIDEDAGQPRYQFDDEALEELRTSIAELGLLSPIKVRPDGGRYTIIYGNRRYKACKLLGLAAIPCIISNASGELDIYLEQVAENLTREGFSPIEEAEAFDRLMNDPKFRSSTKFLSSKLGKTESYIRGKCDLLKFGAEVRKLIVAGTAIRKGRLTEDQVKPLKDLPAEYRDSLALIAAQDEMPASDMKKIARLFKDDGISDSVKSKLLYKTGPGLLDTWSAHEQSKAERARVDDEPAAPPARRSAKTPEPTAAAAEATAAAAEATLAAEAASADSAQNAAAGAEALAAGSPAQSPADASAIAGLLRRLLAATSALPEQDDPQRQAAVSALAQSPELVGDAQLLVARLQLLLSELAAAGHDERS